jgi:hypothetical protein
MALWAEAHRFVTPYTLLHNLIQPLKSATTDKENISRIDLNKVLVGMFASPLRWNISDSALNNL